MDSSNKTEVNIADSTSSQKLSNLIDELKDVPSKFADKLVETKNLNNKLGLV